MKFVTALLAALFYSICAVGETAADSLQMADPESVGFSSERLEKISEFARGQVARGEHAGVVTMVARHGKIVHFEATGQYGVDDDRPMTTDTLFRIFSMTKPITSVALMMLYEEGAFQMSDNVSKYLPQLGNLDIYRDGGIEEAGYEVTIEQLFTHTAGMTTTFRPDNPVDAMYKEARLGWSRDLDSYIETLSQLPLRYEPGTRYHYSVATNVLGALIEKLSGKSLDAFFQERIFTPLGMKDTFFEVPDAKLSRLAGNHLWDKENNRLVPVPEGLLPEYTGVTLFQGAGGLVSTAMDYMIFCDMLRRGGSYNGVRILGPKTVQYMTRNHLTPAVRNNGATEFPESHLFPGQWFGLGFGVMLEPAISGVVTSQGEYSWGGIADTKFIIDPEEDLVAIVMTQLVASPWPTRFRMKVATYQALTELRAGQGSR
jgi:CubicO group peptidase (beta-lactamase class C family)